MGGKCGATSARERSEHAPGVRRLTVHCIGPLDGAALAAGFPINIIFPLV